MNINKDIAEINSLLSPKDREEHKELINKLAINYKSPLIISLLKLGIPVKNVDHAAQIALRIDRETPLCIDDLLNNFGLFAALFSLQNSDWILPENFTEITHSDKRLYGMFERAFKIPTDPK